MAEVPLPEGCDCDTESRNNTTNDGVVLTTLVADTIDSECQMQLNTLPLATTEHLGNHRSYWRDMM